MLNTYRSRCVTDRKNRRKICAILYNLKTANLIKAGFSLNKRDKRAENKSDTLLSASNFSSYDYYNYLRYYLNI